MSVDGLSPKQRAFVEEMLHDGNPRLAALRAGYAVNDLEADDNDPTVADLLADPTIQHAIRTTRAQRQARVDMTRETVLTEMSYLARSSVEHYLIDDDGNVSLAEGAPDGAMRAIQSIKKKVSTRTDKDGNEFRTVDVELKLWDKPNPLKLMGKEVGLFADRVEHTGKDGGPIEYANMTTEELHAKALELARQADALKGEPL